MKRALFALAATATVLVGTAASAQPYGGYYGGYGVHRGHDRDRDGVPNWRDRYDNRHEYDRRRYGGYYSQYYRGGYLPPQYRNDRYVIYDYRRYGWAPPPRGYAYYRTDRGDVVMAAIASGIIGAIIGSALDNDRDRYYYDYRR